MPGTERPPAGWTPSAVASALHGGALSMLEPPPALVTATTVASRTCSVCGATYPGDFLVCPKDATELLALATSADDPLLGTVLGGSYAVVRLLGEGGMGRVYEAQHTRIRARRFAVKTLHDELAKDSVLLARFAREAEAAASIRSPHVVEVVDVGRTDAGVPYLVTELLSGKDLSDHLAAVGRLPWTQAVPIARQVATALVAAHAVGVVHRDIKPENVFVLGDLSDLRVKVIDFGISKLRESEPKNLTQTGAVMGTPSFMSPEQARGERVDERTDVYAVCALLYALLTGQRPFERPEATATMLAVLMEDAPRVSSIEPTTPPGLEHLVERAMAKDPTLRYPTMADLEIALLAWESPQGNVRADTARNTPAPETSVTEARPELFFSSVLAVVLTMAALISFGAGLLRLVRGGVGAPVSGLDAFLLVGFVVLVLATPVLLAARGLVLPALRNSVETRRLLALLRSPLRAALVAYGFASLLVRVLEVVVLGSGLGQAWPGWDLLLAVVAFAAAGAAFAHQRVTGTGVSS
jgi:tRNA A-37 threonylcarbamoyl transferase component Bud32